MLVIFCVELFFLDMEIRRLSLFIQIFQAASINISVLVFLALVLLLLGVFGLRFRLRGSRGRELGRKAVSSKLKLEFLGRSRDWHA
jgi:hypothetical protein